ncbi:MAG: response regulator [Hyphomicrobium sp.]
MVARLSFLETYKPIIDSLLTLSSIVNLIGWIVGAILVYRAWQRNAISSIAVGPINFRLQEAAVEAAAAAARDWQAKTPEQQVDVPRIRATVRRAFMPEIVDKLIGKAVLWVDDNPKNNELAVRAFRKLQLDVEQVTSTEMALAALARRHVDLIISDMGRGDDMLAGYKLLEAVRAKGNQTPLVIFAGSDTPEFRRMAVEKGAQLSTNDMLELIDETIDLLAK